MSESFFLGDELQNAEMADYSPVPAGTYKVQCDKSESKTTRDGTGTYISAQFTIVSDNYKGRKLFHNFNVKSKSTQAQSIGLSELKSLLLAGGVMPQAVGRVSMPEGIVGLVVEVTTKIESSDTYGDSARIKSFKACTAEGIKATQASKELKTAAITGVADKAGYTQAAPF